MCGWDRVEAHAAARKHAAKCRRDHRLKQHPRWHVPVDHAIRPDLHHHAYRIPGLTAAGDSQRRVTALRFPASRWRGGAVMTGPGSEMAAGAVGDDHLRASHADREQVIDVLKAAFVQGMLAKDEFDQRVGQALASRTYAQLAAVTADLPAKPTAAQPPEPARAQCEPAQAQCEPPDLRPGRVIMVATALYAGVWPFTFLLPWPTNSEGDPPKAIILLFFSTTLIYSSVLLFVLFVAVLSIPAWWREKRSGGQPPRRPASGADGQASRRPPSAGPGGRLLSVTGVRPGVRSGDAHSNSACAAPYISGQASACLMFTRPGPRPPLPPGS